MSLATTVAKAATAIEGVAGVENVRSRPGIPLDYGDATLTWLTESGEIQRWTLYYATFLELKGAGNEEIELAVRVVAEWSYREANPDNFINFATLLMNVQLALADRTTGFPQIKEPGISVVEAPGDPIRIETGEAALRAQFGFDLLSITDT